MRHDRAYKALFSHPLAVRDLLREFVADQLEGGREWVERLDFSTLEPLPTERIDPTLRARANDLVWRVRFRDPADGPEWLHVLLMLEFQSSVDWFMALRVQGYAVRLYESLWQGRRRGRVRGRRSRGSATCWWMWGRIRGRSCRRAIWCRW